MKCVLCQAPAVDFCDSEQRFRHCQVCDLRFLEPSLRLPASEEKARYLTHENDVHDLKYRRFVMPLVEAVETRIAKGSSGLDFGAGFAPVLLQIFSEKGFAMKAYDPFFQIHPAALETQYDFIVTSEAAEHFFYPDQEIQRLHQCLKPGGWLGIMTLLFDPERMDFETWYYRRDPTHVVFFSRITFAWIAKHYGFADLTYVGDRIVLLTKGVT